MQQKNIFLDVDNTLFNHHTESMPASTLAALQQARRNGHRLILCTGRNPTMSNIVDQSLFDAFIYCAGAVIADRGQILYQHFLRQEIATTLLREVAAGRIYLNIESVEAVYMSDFSFKIYSTSFETGVTNDQATIERLGLRHLRDYAACGIPKMLMLALDLATVKEILAPYLEEIDITQGRRKRGIYTPFEITYKGINKGSGIKFLAEHFHMPPESLCAIGDGHNDMEMLTTCTTGIAMGDGVPELKAVADYVTTPIDQDGIYQAFAHLDVL